MRVLTRIAVAALLLSGVCGWGVTAKAEAPDRAGDPPNPAMGMFSHPGLYHNSADLAFMRAKIAARAEPWFRAWTQLRSEGTSKLHYAAHPVILWDADTNSHMQGDAVAAYSHALQWALTGDRAHAAKAIEILNAWSATLKRITGRNSQAKLVCGWNACHLANAAELLCHAGPPGAPASGWDLDDIARFKRMLGIMFEVMKDFQPHFNGNWDAAMMNSMLCIAVFCDDRPMFDRVISHFHGNYQLTEGDAKHGDLITYIFPSGQCQESGRDQSHAQMGLGHYVALCEVAWKQGIDLYGDTDNRLRLGLEYTAKYMLGHEVPFVPDSFGKEISKTDRDKPKPIWEAAYQHYVFRKGLEMPFTEQMIFREPTSPMARPYRPESSSPLTGICWGTLTMFKGSEDPQAVKR